MIEVSDIKIETAILIGLKTKNRTKEQVEENIDELERLANTAGAKVILKMIQVRMNPDPASFIGKGKVEEIAELVDLNDISLVIFDDDLNPTQVRNLEQSINKKIIDRSGLILDIFASHAQSKQAKTQVELAQLQYLLPRLTRAWTHLSKQYGGIGTKGPGETQIETDRRIIRTRIAKLKTRLTNIEKQQITKSSKRENISKVSLVGYTNAGKSTLLNLLTGADILAEDKLFATLDSTTKIWDISSNKKYLISDTVGFIRKLPHHLIESFKSTLQVVSQADLIIHLVDISHSFYEDHIEVVQNTLKELNCDKKPTLLVFNKIDLLEEKSKLNYVYNNYKNSISISAFKCINIPVLTQKVLDQFAKHFSEHTLKLHVSNAKLISMIHNFTDVIKQSFDDENISITFRANDEYYNKILGIYNEKKKTSY